MIVLGVISFLLCVAHGNQYIELPFSIDALNLTDSSFTTSWTINYDDTHMEMINLPFEFPFYDKRVSQVWISPNGYISIIATPRCLGYFERSSCTISSVYYDSLIAPYLTDLDPTSGINTTTIMYRIESDRLIVIYNDVPDYYHIHYNSFMVILYASGDIVFSYKDINWPIAPIGTRKRGFVGIRPQLRNTDYSTRGTYISSNQNIWDFSVIGNYASISHIDAITERFTDPAEFIYSYVELFILMPTEVCTTPYYVLPGAVTNISLSFSYLSTGFLRDNLIRCTFGSSIVTVVKILSSQEFVCITPDLSQLQGIVSIKIELFSPPENTWTPIEFSSPPSIFVTSQANTTHITCEGDGSCDRCGVCFREGSASDGCIGRDGTIYGPATNACPDGLIPDTDGICCDPEFMDCQNVCGGEFVIGTSLTNRPTCCNRRALDCMNICNGQAQLDECEVCSGGTSNHVANTDRDCSGVCFGSDNTNCDISLHITPSELDYQLGLSEDLYRVTHEAVLWNHGTHKAVLYSVTPTTLNRDYAPIVTLSASVNNRSVSLLGLVVDAKSSVQLTIEAEMESFVKHQMNFYGGRKGVTISFLFVPLTMNQTERKVVTLHLSFNTTQCELLTDYTMCYTAPHCFTCIFSKDHMGDLAWMVRPLAASRNFHPLSASDSCVFSCLYGNSTSVCDSLDRDVSSELAKVKWELNLDETRIIIIILCTGMICIMCAIVFCEYLRVRRLRQFYSEM